jgi:hypothetical protein
VCGDGACTHDEDATSCRIDCPVTCGDDICSDEEDPTSCAVDCGCAARDACGHAAPGGCECDVECIGNNTCCPDACPACDVCPCVIAGDITDRINTQAVTGTNASGNDNVDSTCVSRPGEEVVYTVTPSSAERLVVSLVNPGTDYDTGLSVRSSSCEAGDEVACNDDFDGDQSQVTFDAEAGRTYYIVVEGADGDTGEYELTLHRAGVCEGVAPVVDATRLIANGTTVVTTSSGVHSLRGNCVGGESRDGLLWFVAPRDGTIVASTNFLGTTYDSVLYAREEDCDARSAELACNDDDEQIVYGSRLRSQIAFAVRRGSTYYIVVDGYGGASGRAEVGLGYGGTSPLRGEISSAVATRYDTYRVYAGRGSTIAVAADTVSAASATDLAIEIDSLVGGRIARFDDEMDCSYPPPDGSRCPRGSLRVPLTSFYFVRVISEGAAAEIATAGYRLSVTVAGTDAVLMAVQDN